MGRLGATVLCVCALGLAVAGCGDDDGTTPLDAAIRRDAGAAIDASAPGDGGDDASTDDAAIGELDAAQLDAGELDAAQLDAGELDAAQLDAGELDASALDASSPSPLDAGPPDAGPPDAGPPDAGNGGCISGATGTHAVRFRWEGSSSRAYVRYEVNTLPDTSRWRVGAYSRSIGYSPVYTDTFLGEGGLELSGTVFIDVELSTLGLGALHNVTIAIYGRSFATTTSGSFEWQTFEGVGASPYGGVANSAPYEWYVADATTEFAPGDDGVLLRIRPGPPSNALVVNRVEICFDAP